MKWWFTLRETWGRSLRKCQPVLQLMFLGASWVFHFDLNCIWIWTWVHLIFTFALQSYVAQDEVFQAIWCRCQWLLDPSSTHAESWQRLRIEGLRFEDPWFDSVMQAKMCKIVSTILLCMSPLMRRLFSSQQLKSTRTHVLQSWYIVRICSLPIADRQSGVWKNDCRTVERCSLGKSEANSPTDPLS